MHGFVLDVEKFGFKACFFEVIDGTNEAFVVGCVRSKWKILFASDSLTWWCWHFSSAGGDFKLSCYTGSRVMVILNKGFEWGGWLLCSMKFCDGSHGECC